MSILAPIIGELSGDHNLIPGIDSEKKRFQGADGNRCRLSSGIEYSFVSLFCDEIIRRLPQQNLPQYQHIFFIPNLKAEAKVGYDLSIGHYSQNSRVRTMHKVVNEKYCDQPWSYRFRYARNRRGEDAGDYGHFKKLLDAHQEDLEHPVAQISPFLVINICYCIHDYRRMGALFEPEQLTIPPFESLLRTVIVDLRILREHITRQNIDISSAQFYLKLSRRPERRLPQESSQEYIAKIANKANIRIECSGGVIDPANVILSFGEFLQQIDWDSLVNNGVN